MNSFLDKAKAGAADLATKAKAAAQLAAKQAEKTKITQMALPSAYQALGKHLHGQSNVRAEFPKNIEVIDGLLRQLESLQAAAAGRASPQSVGDRAKAIAQATKELAESKTIQLRLSQAFSELGKVVFERDGERFGPDALTRPILDAQARIAALNSEIENLEAAHKGQLITPKRLALATILVLVVGVIVVGSRMFGTSHHAAEQIDGSVTQPTTAIASQTAVSNLDTTQVIPTVSTNAPYAQIAKRYQQLRVDAIARVLKEQGVQDVQSLPADARMKAAQELNEQITSLFAEAPILPISIGENANNLVSSVRISRPLLASDQSSFKVTLVARTAVTNRLEKGPGLMWRAYDADGTVLKENFLDLDAKPGQEFTATLWDMDSVFPKLHSFKVWRDTDKDELMSSQQR